MLSRPLHVLAPLALAAVLPLSLPGLALAASEERTAALTVPAQPLDQALLALAQQAELTVILDPTLVEGRTAPALNGELAVGDAFRTLLTGSGLTARFDGSVVTIVAVETPSATGPDTSPEGERLAPVVVTASGFEQSVLRAPASITIVTREELERRPITDVTDIIRTVPGASLTNGEGRNVDISLRGMPSGYTLILIDGRRQNLNGIARQGNNNVRQSFIPPPSAIERVEVIRGPMSTLYGADALGGVINIITKKSAETWGGEITTDYLAQEESRFGDARGSSLFLNGPIIGDKVGLQITGRHQYREEDQVPRGQPQRTNRNLTGRIWINPSANQDIMLETSQEYFNMYAMVAGRSPGTLWEQTTRRETWSVAHAGRWAFGKTDIAFQKEDARKSNIEADNWTLDAKMVMPWTGAGAHVTTVGTQLTRNKVNAWNIETVDGDIIDVIEQKNYAVFVEDEWSLTPSLALTLGTRFDDPDDFASHVSPRGYLVWSATPNIVLKGGVATGFVAPRADYVANGLVTQSEDTTSGALSYTYANPELEPETSTNYEVSAIWQGDDGRYASLTLFQTDYEDKLSSNSYEVVSATSPFDAIGPMDPRGLCAAAVGNYGCSWTERVNIDKAESRGVELAADTPLAGPMSLQASYTFLQSEQQSGANIGQPLSGSPKHKLVTTLEWTWSSRLDTWLSYSYRSRLQASNRPAPGCFASDSCPSLSLVDLGGTVRASDDLRFNLGAYNLTNRKWFDYDSRGSVEDGRRYYVRATYAF